jgi:hypothetical protein
MKEGSFLVMFPLASKFVSGIKRLSFQSFGILSPYIPKLFVHTSEHY